MNMLSLCPRRRGVPALLGRVVAVAALTLCAAAPATAQLFSARDNPNLGAVPVRGTDTAYDPVNNVYLVVGSTAGNTMTPLYGVFTNAAGVPITSLFQINTDGWMAHFPRVTYSPHVSNGAGGFGGFLVTWHGGLFTNSIRARVVAYPNRIVSPEATIASPPGSTFQEAGPAVAYSSVSYVFLVTWQGSNFGVYGALINVHGQAISGAFLVSDVPAVQNGFGYRDPAVAWNSHTNEFGVLYTGFSPWGATTSFARVNPSGNVLRRHMFNVTASTYISELAFNPATGRYIAAWFQGGTYGAEIDAYGDIVATGLVSTATGTRDGLGLAYNPISGTFLLAGMGQSYNIWAAELNSRGARTSGDGEITALGAKGTYHPRAAANTNSKAWNVSFFHDDNGVSKIRNQVVSTSSTGGGPAGSLGGGSVPPPSSPPPPTGGCTTPDPFAALGGGTCVNGGWVPPSGGGSTGGCTTASPGAGWTCVNGGWLPPTSGGTSTGTCTTASPGAGWTCVNGGWLPPTSGGTSTGGCATGSPGAGWVCVNGGWLPPGSGGGGSTTTCTTGSPGAGWVCVNGGWLPPGSGGGGSTTTCTTGSPGAGWVCVNGGWLPPGSGGGGSTTCTTGSPGAGWVCVNGGWLPPGSGGSTSGGCTTGSPGTGWVCVNGGWLPPGSGGSTSGGCTTGSPGTGWVCVNGGWLPPGTTTGGSSSTCSTPDPFAAFGGGTCTNGGWTFGTVSSGGCTTPDPFTAMGGGICSNGGWVPRSED